MTSNPMGPLNRCLDIENINLDSIPHLSLSISEKNVIAGAKEILQIIRPEWDLKHVKFKKFTDGITNKLLGCFHTPIDDITHSHESTSSVVLVRVYGSKTDLLIDRKMEIRNIVFLNYHGLAPELFATFNNGIIYDFVSGTPLNCTSVLRPEIWQLIAKRMAEMHRVAEAKESGSSKKFATSGKEPMLWKKMQHFFNIVPDRFSDPKKNKRFQATFKSISDLHQEFGNLYKHLVCLESPIVFAHNDLLLGNIIFDESQQMVSFIDYEYADFNFQAFDIGNHFAEFAGIDEPDFSRYPSRTFQFDWIRMYLQAFHNCYQVSEADIEHLYVQVNHFTLASHLFWCVWSLIQAEHSNIDFDYLGYAELRYKEYFTKKDQILALKFKNRSKDF